MLPNTTTEVIKYKFSFKVTDGFLKTINIATKKLLFDNGQFSLPTKKNNMYCLEKNG